MPGGDGSHRWILDLVGRHADKDGRDTGSKGNRQCGIEDDM